MINDLIDEAINKLLAMTMSDYNSFKPETVAEKLAMVLVDAAIRADADIRAIQIVADRSAGKASPVKKEGNTQPSDINRTLMGFAGGSK